MPTSPLENNIFKIFKLLNLLANNIYQAIRIVHNNLPDLFGRIFTTLTRECANSFEIKYSFHQYSNEVHYFSSECITAPLLRFMFYPLRKDLVFA